MNFVVNEWLPEYFRPEATAEEKQKLEQFINTFLQRNDTIYVRRPSEFLTKIYRYSKSYQTNTNIYLAISAFIKFILFDSQRCRFIDDDEYDLSDAIHQQLVEGGNTISDTYLFEAAAATEEKLIVTTDVKLRNLMRQAAPYTVVLLDDFLANYQ
jgi:hypothetical protein